MPKKKKAEDTTEEVVDVQDVPTEDTFCYTFITNVTIMLPEGEIHHKEGSRIKLTEKEATQFKGMVVKTKIKGEDDCGC